MSILESQQTDGERLARMGTDAVEWAKEFTRLHGGDEGLMIGWFANAIMAGWDQGQRQLRFLDAVGMVLGVMVQSLTRAGIEQGLPPDKAQRLVVHTVLGSGRLMDEGADPGAEAAQMAYPGSCTAEGLEVLRVRGVCEAIDDAVSATMRSR